MSTPIIVHAQIRGVDCEVEVSAQEDAVGAYTSIYVASIDDGCPIAEGHADGVLSEIDAWRLARALQTGAPTPGVVWETDEVAA